MPAESSTYDLLICGAGPAGTTAAAYARQAGLTVLLVEKETFPRFRIGESLLPNLNHLLRETGAWPKVEAAGFIRKHGARFHLANGLGHREVQFTRGLVSNLDYTYQVERARFDQILLDHARSLGADLAQPATVTAVETTDDHHTITLTAPDRATRTVTARWFLDAGGRDNFYPAELKRHLDPAPWAKRLAIYNHFTGVARPADRTAGHTVIVRLHDGWFWLIPIDDTRTSVGLVTTAETFKNARLSPDALFRHAIASSPVLTDYMAAAQSTMATHVTSDYSYFRQHLAHHRTLLLGDAAGFYDPIFSSGAYLAAYSAKLAIAALTLAHREKRPLLAKETTAYTANLKKHANVYRRLIEAFYDNHSYSIFLADHAPLSLDRAVNSILAGHAKLTWPIWWRFKLFLLCCRHQARFKFVPQLDYTNMPPLAAPNSAPVGAALRRDLTTA